MALTDYQITPAGAARLVHNGTTVHAGRKLLLDSVNPTTIYALKQGWISTTVVATTYEGDPANLTTYTVQATGNNKILHNGATKTTGQTIQLESGDDTARRLVAIGYIA